MTDQALSVVGRGLVAWLTDHGPATAELIRDHFAGNVVEGYPTFYRFEMFEIIKSELRHLESLGHVRRVPYDNTGARSALWAAVPQPATTIHIQRPTENPL